jgi:hypothetical protein
LEITDERAPTCQTPRAAPGPRGSTPLPRGHHADAAVLSRCRDSAPRVPTARLAPIAPSRSPLAQLPRLAHPSHAVARSEADRRCPAASAIASMTTVSVARALLSPFFIRGASSSPSPSPPHRRRTTAGHRSPTSSEKRSRRAGFLLLTVDEELR